MEEQENEPLTMELYLLLPTYLTSSNVCSQCGEHYKECENIGRHLCRIHPGVRLLTYDCIPQRVFYSCCSQSVHSRGCLQLDHSLNLFSESNAHKRLQQLAEFAIVTVPRLLLRFMTRPMASSILYDSERCFIESFVHHFGALREAASRTQALRIRHEMLLRDYGSGCLEEEEEERRESGDPTIRRFDLVSEERALVKASQESPLFSRLSCARQERRSANTSIITACDSAWRTRLGTPTQEGPSTACNYQERLAFVIISRINDRLDLYIK